MSANYDRLLSKALLQRLPIASPPASIDALGHYFEDNDLVSLRLGIFPPSSLSRLAGKSGEATKLTGQFIGEARKFPVRYGSAFIVEQREQYLD